ncbi:MAG: choice-of-anchor I family protein [Culicoidibacterales bacterium]
MKKNLKKAMTLMVATSVIGNGVSVYAQEIENQTNIQEGTVESEQTQVQSENNPYAQLKINEVYGGGGKAGKSGQANAPYAYDFIELYNDSTTEISLAGLKLVYTNNSAGTIQTYTFSEGQVIQPADYFLLRCESTVGNMGEKGFGEIFNADAFYDIPEKGIGMSDTKGSVQLLTSTDVEIDAVNYGGASNGIGEGASIKGVDYLTSVQRQNFQDTDDNATDFVVQTPTPQKSGGDVEILQVFTIEKLQNTPELLGELVSFEATVTAKNLQTSHTATEKLTYLQDFTGGIAVENTDEVSGEIGQKVFVTGELVEVDGEVRVNAVQTALLSDIVSPHQPTPFTAQQAVQTTGWLASVSGQITEIDGNMLMIDQTLPVFIDTSIVRQLAVNLGDFINVQGVLATVENQTRLVAASADVVQKEQQFYPTLTINKIAGYSTGMASEDGGVAEIVKFNADNNKFYLINGLTQTIEIVDLANFDVATNTVLTKEKEINLAEALNDDTFTFGDITSIDINTTKKVIVAAVQEADYLKGGKIVVLNYDGEVIEVFDCGIQPDMVTMTEDGNYILSADEAEPRNGKTGEDNWDPEGSVTIVNYETKTTQIVKFDDETKIAADVHIRNTAGGAVADLEPEYIAFSADETAAYVVLQENNAIATIDIETGSVTRVDSLGFKDHSLEGNELDAGRDGEINIETLPIKGLYMPDAITSVVLNGKEYLVTANEGDATEWGKKEQAFTNVADFKTYFADKDLSVTDETFGGYTAQEAQEKLVAMKEAGNYDKLEVVTDMGDDAIYVLGGRSFAIWDAQTMELVFDSGSDFEKITAEVLPEGFNWSNDDNELDKRSSKKGPEPEGITVGVVNDKVYAFVGLERIGGIMTYDITTPESATFANYINTRDFTNKIAGDVAPEGLEFISAAESPTKKPILLVGNEVSGTVSLLELDVTALDADAEVDFGAEGDVTPSVDADADEDFGAEGDVTPSVDADAEPGFGSEGDVTPSVDADAEPGFGAEGDVTPSVDADVTTTGTPVLPNTGGFQRELFGLGSIATLVGSFAFWKRKK